MIIGLVVGNVVGGLVGGDVANDTVVDGSVGGGLVGGTVPVVTWSEATCQSGRPRPALVDAALVGCPPNVSVPSSLWRHNPESSPRKLSAKVDRCDRRPQSNKTASSAVQCTLWSVLPQRLTRVSAVLVQRCVHPRQFTQDACPKVGRSCRRSQSNRTASSAVQCTLWSDLPRWLTRVRAVLAWRCVHP